MPPFTLDQDGFLVDLSHWSPQVAQLLAQRLGISLQPAHWQVLDCARQFYAERQLSPAMRALINRLNANQHTELASSLALSALFPEATSGSDLIALPRTHIAKGSPAKRIAGIAGLPRPTNCI